MLCFVFISHKVFFFSQRALFVLFCFILFCFVLFCKRDKERVSRGGAEQREGGGQRIRSRLRADSREPDMRLKLKNPEIMTWAVQMPNWLSHTGAPITRYFLISVLIFSLTHCFYDCCFQHPQNCEFLKCLCYFLTPLHWGLRTYIVWFRSF